MEDFDKKTGILQILRKMHEIPIAKITLNRGQKTRISQRTGCGQNINSLKYHKFQNVEKEVEDHTDDRLSKNSSR